MVFVDGLSVGDTSQDVLNERSMLVEMGVASIACAITAGDRKPVGKVEVQMRGIAGGEDPYLIEDAQSAVQRALRRSLEGHAKRREVEKACRQALQQVLWERIKQRPMVIVNLIEI